MINQKTDSNLFDKNRPVGQVPSTFKLKPKIRRNSGTEELKKNIVIKNMTAGRENNVSLTTSKRILFIDLYIIIRNKIPNAKAATT